jgi:hypothetical protein
VKKSDLQWEFLQCLAKLIEYVNVINDDPDDHDLKLTMGRGYASKAANAADGGHEKSTHLHRLAMDLNLFVDGELISDSDHPLWTELGEYWEGLHELARNGRLWKDANHFSFEWDGVK